jgi:predicted membrane protein
MANYWPLVFVGVGILMILRRNDRGEYFHHRWVRDHEASSYNSTDGFVTSNNSFGSVHQIVVDPVFKGAVISNSFGSTVLDLRRTSLEQKETYIDVDSSFGGIEIFVPESWTVKSIVKNSFSGFVDKRYNTMVMDNTKIILIRGSISFSGLEVKS